MKHIKIFDKRNIQTFTQYKRPHENHRIIELTQLELTLNMIKGEIRKVE